MKKIIAGFVLLVVSGWATAAGANRDIVVTEDNQKELGLAFTLTAVQKDEQVCVQFSFPHGGRLKGLMRAHLVIRDAGKLLLEVPFASPNNEPSTKARGERKTAGAFMISRELLPKARLVVFSGEVRHVKAKDSDMEYRIDGKDTAWKRVGVVKVSGMRGQTYIVDPGSYVAKDSKQLIRDLKKAE